jgi:hypothetical protein
VALPAALIGFMRGHGRRKVLFGSNYPMLTPSQALEEVERLGLDEQAFALFLGRNAERVFRLDKSDA